MASPAASYPEPRRRAGSRSDIDDVEPAAQWAGDTVAAAKFDSPEAIRAALLGEQVAEFDAAYDAALISARQTLHLDQLRHVLRMWRRMALMAEQDPQVLRRTLATAAEVQLSGQPRPGSVSWDQLKVELGL